ncbi:MAG: hypothetical protein OXI46_10400 [Gemmatimonadota bacterium]|nr:hypothetical protein [Gemmatimonadota bacterium]
MLKPDFREIPVLRLRIRSDYLSNEPMAPPPIHPDQMQMDPQTFGDLEIFKATTGPCVYDLCNQTRTEGGAKRLRGRMKKPWATPERIRGVQDSIRFVNEHRSAFDRLPWDTVTGVVERYLRRGGPVARDARGLGLLIAALELRFSDARNYGRVMRGVLSTFSMIRHLRSVLEALGSTDGRGEIRELMADTRSLLTNPDVANVPAEERYDISPWRLLSYDQAFRGHGRETVERLLRLVHELDALVAMADTVAKHGFVMPEIREGSLHVVAEGVFHPFIEHAIANPVELDQGKRMLFLTGPNMAGKTTYLRATGMAMYLAHLGMGVPARSFCFAPCQRLFTSITITDDIRTGVSFFRAEALRMKAVAKAVAEGARVVALLDEPFKGTNLKDALDASREILERLAERPDNLFMVASHLIELGEHMATTGNVDCRLFEASEDDERLHFEYVLRDGISSQRLGMRVLREEGIFDLLDGMPTTSAVL